jgi:hypothetical protein
MYFLVVVGEVGYKKTGSHAEHGPGEATEERLEFNIRSLMRLQSKLTLSLDFSR